MTPATILLGDACFARYVVQSLLASQCRQHNIQAKGMHPNALAVLHHAVQMKILILPYSDPTAALLKFAEERGRRVEVVSLGQGQGPVAQRWIDEGVQEGFWVVLQNCHLAKSFLPQLELICEQQLQGDKVHYVADLGLRGWTSKSRRTEFGAWGSNPQLLLFACLQR